MQEKKKLVNIPIYIYTTYFGFLTKKKQKKKLTKIKPSWQVEKQKRTYHKISSSTTECCTNERLWYCPIKLRLIRGSGRPLPGVSLSALCSLQQGCKWTTCESPWLTNLMAILFVHSLIFFSNTSLSLSHRVSSWGNRGSNITVKSSQRVKICSVLTYCFFACTALPSSRAPLCAALREPRRTIGIKTPI